MFALLRADGRHKGWLAEKIGYSHAHVRNVAAGQFPATSRFRAECARVFERPEAELFCGDDQGDTSSASAHGEPSYRAGPAVRGRYATAGVSSTPEEAPSIVA